jgi:hypothetical protein
MEAKSSLLQMASRVEELGRLAQDLFDASEDFPAVNCNAKRILAAIAVLRLNLDDVSD